jgi:RimJ/RimL family protein N-acetyltransferase
MAIRPRNFGRMTRLMLIVTQGGQNGPAHARRVRDPGLMRLPLTTARLVLDEPSEDDLPGLLAVAQSNPDFLATHEGSAGEAGRYDIDMLARDLAVAQMDPERHALVIRRRDDGAVVGRADTLDRHPRDLVPWIGALELHADAQRGGLGREAAEALADWYRSQGEARLRLGVDDGNDRAAAFWEALGYVNVDRRERDSPLGRLGVDVLELALR